MLVSNFWPKSDPPVPLEKLGLEACATVHSLKHLFILHQNVFVSFYKGCFRGYGILAFGIKHCPSASVAFCASLDL